jgi:hypothetical protein
MPPTNRGIPMTHPTPLAEKIAAIRKGLHHGAHWRTQHWTPSPKTWRRWRQSEMRFGRRYTIYAMTFIRSSQ